MDNRHVQGSGSRRKVSCMSLISLSIELKVTTKFRSRSLVPLYFRSQNSWPCSYPGRVAARRRGWWSALARPPASRVPVPASSYLHITVTSYHHIMMVWSNDKLLHGSTAPPSHQRCLECMQVQYSSDEYFSCVYDQIFISRDLSWRFPIDWSFSAIIIKINDDIITWRVDGCKQCQLYVFLTNNYEFLETRQAHLK